MQLFYSATVVEMTPVAQTIVEFYEIMHFLSETTPFFKKKNYPPFIKNYEPPPYKKRQPLISAFLKNSIFGNNRDPWTAVLLLILTSLWIIRRWAEHFPMLREI